MHEPCLLEMLRGKCPTGMRFQIPLKGGSALPGSKGDRRVHLPGSISARKWTLASVVSPQALREIRCEAGVVFPWAGNAAEDVDVVICHRFVSLMDGCSNVLSLSLPE